MRAIVCTKYGPPEVLQLEEVEKPAPKANEVLIKVHATTCHIGDVRVRGFDVPFWQRIPFRLFLGILRPRQPILGMEVAGEVEEVGENVEGFKKGDQVFATSGFVFGSHAEYTCLPVDAKDVKKGLVAKMPTNIEAHRYVEKGHKKGHVVITVVPDPGV